MQTLVELQPTPPRHRETQVPESRTGFSLSIMSISAAFTNREAATATSLSCPSRSSSLASPQMEKQTSSQALQSVPQHRLAAEHTIGAGARGTAPVLAALRSGRGTNLDDTDRVIWRP